MAALKCVLLIFLFISYTFCINRLEDLDPYEKAKYHLQGLVSSLEEIDQPHQIYRRSTNKDVLDSLASVCAKLYDKSPPKGAKNQLTRNETLKGSLVRDWPKPPVFLNKISAERIRSEDKVKVTFDVIHSSSLLAARQYSFDYSEQTFDGPVDGKSFTSSQVQFTVDDKYCRLHPDEDDTIYPFFSFSTGDDLKNEMFISIDLCRFDITWDNEEDEWTTRDEKVISQDDHILPRYRITPDPGDTLVIPEHKPLAFDIDLNLCSTCSFAIQLNVWDWERNSTYSESIMIAHSYGDRQEKRIEVYDRRDDEERDVYGKKLTKLKILREIPINDTVFIEKNGREKKVRETGLTLRYTADIGGRRISGDLVFEYFRRHMRRVERPIIRHLYWNRHISLKLPHKLAPFPKGYISISAEDVTYCEIDDDEREDKNCSVECFTWGNDIKTIFITKTNQYRLPYRSVSYVQKGGAGYAKIDVGAPSERDNEGTYKCIVISKSGNVETKEIKLISLGEPKVKDLVVEQFNNGSSKLVCTAIGHDPLSISLTAEDKDRLGLERLDNKLENRAYLEKGVDNTTLTLILSTDQLQIPHWYVSCEASNEQGEDTYRRYLPNYIKENTTIF